MMHDSGNILIPIPAFLKFLIPILIPGKTLWFRFQHNLIFLIPIPAKNRVILESIAIPESELGITALVHDKVLLYLFILINVFNGEALMNLLIAFIQATCNAHNILCLPSLEKDLILKATTGGRWSSSLPCL